MDIEAKEDCGCQHGTAAKVQVAGEIKAVHSSKPCGNRGRYGHTSEMSDREKNQLGFGSDKVVFSLII